MPIAVKQSYKNEMSQIGTVVFIYIYIGLLVISNLLCDFNVVQ